MKAILCLPALLALTGLVLADEKPTLEEKIKDSSSLKLEAQVVKKGDAIRQVTPVMMDKPFLTDWFADGPRSVKIEGDKVQAWFKARKGGDSVHAFKLEKGKLVYDTTFGEKGIAPFDRKKGDWKPRENFGDWGDDVITRPLGELVGKKDTSQEEDKGHLLIVEDANGKKLTELGCVDKDDTICWLHNYCRYKDIVFLVDGNCRKIGVWTIKGKHLFNIECRELGLDYPWVQAIDITDKGELYLGFTQKRPKADGKGKSGIQEAAFLKITGLDSIK